MALQLLGWKDILTVRTRLGRIPTLLVKGIHDQRPVDFDELILARSIKKDPAAKTPLRRSARLMEHRIGPHRHHLRRRTQFGFLARCQPWNRPIQIQARAAAGGNEPHKSGKPHRHPQATGNDRGVVLP
jgi:hypothetical protein